VGEIVSQEGRDHQLQEESPARMEQPQEVRHGKATPRPLLCRLAERVLEGGNIGHRAAQAIAENGTMTMPPLFVQGGSLYGTAEALSEEVKTHGRCLEAANLREIPGYTSCVLPNLVPFA
jgi:hypothetical protein